MALMMFDSVRERCPDCRCVVLTDKCTTLARLPKYVEVIRRRVQLENLMYERTRLQVEYLRCAKAACNIFVDTDMLILDDVRNWFSDSFDVGVTCRDSKRTDMPINGGLILCRTGSRALRFLESVEYISREQYKRYGQWFGDQYALRDAVGQQALEASVSRKVKTASGVTVNLLPAETYNWTPRHGYRSIARIPSAKLVHFKGVSKEMMLPFWLAHFERSAMSRLEWRCRIAWRAARSMARRARSAVRRMNE